MEKILDYVPMHYFYCDYYDQQFGDVTDMNGGDDKWEQYQLFQERGIKTPEVIALIKRNVLQRTNGISFSWEELKVWLRMVNGCLLNLLMGIQV